LCSCSHLVFCCKQSSAVSLSIEGLAAFCAIKSVWAAAVCVVCRLYTVMLVCTAAFHVSWSCVVSCSLDFCTSSVSGLCQWLVQCEISREPWLIIAWCATQTALSHLHATNLRLGRAT
jgi:hypothetical protein